MSTILAIEDIVHIRKRLESCKTSSDALGLNDMFDNLIDFKMTVSILKETRIGAVVNKFKEIPDIPSNLKKKASELVSKWRALAPSKTPQQVVNEIKKMVSNTANVSTNYTGPTTGNTRRDQSRAALYKGFIEGMDPETKQHIKSWAVNIVANLEEACFVAHVKDGSDDYTLYSSQVRSIKFNLSDTANYEFNKRILTGELAAEQVALMSSKEMASEAKKRERDQHVKEATEACQTDFEQQRMLEGGIKGMFKCGKCKSDQTTHSQAQTRSSDEPMTTFVQCLNCGNRWRF